MLDQSQSRKLTTTALNFPKKVLCVVAAVGMFPRVSLETRVKPVWADAAVYVAKQLRFSDDEVISQAVISYLSSIFCFVDCQSIIANTTPKSQK